MKKKTSFLAIKFNRKAARMLIELANLPPENICEFGRKWQGIFELPWSESELRWAQELVRKIWEGKKKTIENLQIGLCLGLMPPDYADEGEPMIKPPFHVDIEDGGFWCCPQDLNQLVWLVVVQHAKNFAVCQNPDGRGYPHPYFIKYRREQKYCSDRCAAPAKREAKRRWWNENRGKRSHA